VATSTFRNWNGSAISRPAVAVAPRDVEELVRVVREAATYPSPVRTAGSFHSLNDCFVTTGTQVLTRNFHDIRVDVPAGTITVGAGVTMVKIRDALRPFGVQTEVTPEIGNATAGSVACCGTKDASIGKGLAQVSSTVTAMKLVNEHGEIEAVSEETDPERMRILRSSYGLLGLVYEVTFRIQPAVTLRHDYAELLLDPPPTREQLLAGADGALGIALPYRNRIVVERRYVAGDARRPIPRSSLAKRRVRDKLWEVGVSSVSTRLPYNWYFGIQDRALSVILRTLGRLGGFESRRYDSTIDFKSTRSHYFDFTFWAIPWSRWAEFVPDYLRFCRDFLRETGFRVSLLSEVYLMNQDDHSLLSPTKAENAFTVDLTDTRVNHPQWAEFNRRFNELAAGFGGRPLLNQTKQLSRDIVRQTLGSDWERFLAIRAEGDPEGRFLNDYFASLL
jgi:FAD/FMN-containing dehydrogenase